MASGQLGVVAGFDIVFSVGSDQSVYRFTFPVLSWVVIPWEATSTFAVSTDLLQQRSAIYL